MFDDPTLIRLPRLQRTPANICINLNLLNSDSYSYILPLIIIWVYLHSYFLWLAPKDIVCKLRKRIMAVQGDFRLSSKVVDLGINRKRVCDFLIVMNRTLVMVLSCTVWEIRWLIGRKIVSSYPPQSHKLPSLGVTPFEFRDESDISRN